MLFWAAPVPRPPVAMRRLHTTPRSTADAQMRLMDGLEVIRKTWTEHPISHNGRYYEFTNVQVWPRPAQLPHPPIWVACSNTPASFERVGSQGYNLLIIGYTKPVAALAQLTRS